MTRRTFFIIGGLPKTGTTLPLTLLDGHPDLVVFPEEFRFFHTSADVADPSLASARFLSQANTVMLGAGKVEFDHANYFKHGGTGFGTRDYSDFDFKVFTHLVSDSFLGAASVSDRLDAIADAFEQVAYGSVSERPFVAKAPHSELHLQKWLNFTSESSKFIYCIRNPEEHFATLRMLSRRAVSEGAQGRFWPTKNNGVLEYWNLFSQRDALWDQIPDERLLTLVYEDLVSQPNPVIRGMAEFLGISEHECLWTPSKFGTEWLGNSVRGVVEKRIFVTERKAETVLRKSERVVLARLCRDSGTRVCFDVPSWPRSRTFLAFVVEYGRHGLRAPARKILKFGPKIAGCLPSGLRRHMKSAFSAIGIRPAR